MVRVHAYKISEIKVRCKLIFTIRKKKKNREQPNFTVTFLDYKNIKSS